MKTKKEFMKTAKLNMPTKQLKKGLAKLLIEIRARGTELNWSVDDSYAIEERIGQTIDYINKRV